MLENIRIKIEDIWQWLKDHPKKTFQYMLVILVASLCFFIFEIFFSETEKNPIQTQIPIMFDTSDKYINKERKRISLRKVKMEKIVKELKFFKNKKMLTKNDSLRIEYLLNQYSTLKNEK